MKLERVSRWFFLGLLLIGTASADEGHVPSKVVYRKYTEVDLSGEKVQGKIKAPQVFYIFQRKRAGGFSSELTPTSLSHHRGAELTALKGALPDE